MKIFVTGGCGFIGSNYILDELSKGSSILSFDKLTYAGNINNLDSAKNNKYYSFIKGDICSLDNLKNAIYDFSPDIIVHFAAESHVDRSIDSPMNFINTNIVGTANLLNISYDYWKSSNTNFKFIHISTDEVYGSLGKTGLFTEKSLYLPSSPYSASKASSDHLVMAWNKTFDFPAIITHCSNNYGPFQFPEKLIPLIITNCIDKKNLPIYGDGLNIRDWLYVKDHCDAISVTIKKGEIGETYNIGGNNEKTNLDIAKTICRILDKKRPRKNGKLYENLIEFVDDRPGHDYRYAINSSKIQNDLNWSPSESFETGIYKTIEWYLENEPWWRKINN